MRTSLSRGLMIVKCSLDGCDLPHKARGMCNLHWQRWYRANRSCAIAGCERMPSNGKLCSRHYDKHRELNGARCLVDGCEAPQRGLGYCGEHYQRFKRNGDPLKRQIAPRGSGTINSQGYRVYEIDDKVVRESRKVMAEQLGRPLRLDEHVHHKDLNKLNNEPWNLQILTPSQHSKLHNPPTKQCKSGHPWEPETTYWSPDGKRHCRICMKRWDLEKRERKRLQQKAS